MAQSTICNNEKKNAVDFFTQLVKENYQIKGDSPFHLLFDSEEQLPHLKTVENKQYKLNSLINTLVNALHKTGRNVTFAKIKNDLSSKNQKKTALVYQVLILDEKKQTLCDLFFILDIKKLRLFCFKRQTDFSKDNGRLLKVITYLHNKLYKDAGEIFKIIKLNGFNVRFQQLLHLIREIQN